MPDAIDYRPLTDRQLDLLIEQGCCASDWGHVRVEQGFDPSRVRRVHFGGRVRIAARAAESPEDGLYDASICDCVIGRNVRIARVGVRIANYAIGDGAVIEDVGLVATRPGATFGNGVRAQVLNEMGGREVVLFNQLSSQFAYLFCLHRYRPPLFDKLEAIAARNTANVRSDVGSIGPGATIRSVKQMLDVNVGAGAVISGASRMVNGTVLSSLEVPTTVGAEVQCDDFIIAEGSSVTGAAILSKTFVGQACRIGKQYSADQSLFFANSEALHGEAACVLAGPFTVTHHKSTLLIGGLFSFFNAGSGTNQSNHMYKLGPLHEGKLERGTKTGSFCSLLWPSRVGPFSVVLGKHKRHFDTSMLPFSVLDATPEGRCALVPGLNLNSVGTLRDGAKWPPRDGRRGTASRDRVSFDVFSPYTVGRMLRGAAVLADLHESTAPDVETVTIHGADVKRDELRSYESTYRSGAETYLLDKITWWAAQAMAAGDLDAKAFAVADSAVYSDQWLDIGGLLMPRQRFEDLVDAVARGAVADIESFAAELDRIASAYGDDEWAWVRRTHEQVSGCNLDDASADDVIVMADRLLELKDGVAKLVLADARKEFTDQARIGYGQDGSSGDVDVDFASVRGSFEDNPFVKQVQEELAAIRDRVARLKERLVPR